MNKKIYCICQLNTVYLLEYNFSRQKDKNNGRDINTSSQHTNFPVNFNHHNQRTGGLYDETNTIRK